MYPAAPHLLITDDDTDFRSTLRSVFESRGFRTTEAADGGEAIRIVHEDEVHVVLMDMHMPRVTGIEAMRELKRFNSQLPCILISGAIDDQIVAEATQIPVYSILRKPISVRELTHTVFTALNERYAWDLS